MFPFLLFSLESQAQTVGICDRAAGIQNAVIANSTLGLACENITPAHLADITFLDASSRGIERLSAGDLAGLTNMVKLDLGGNRIKTISEDLFDGLTNLEIIYIDGSELTGLPENLFNELTSLEELVLNSNSLSSLPEDLFDGLISLERLDIDNNKLTNLHEDQFDGLTELKHLDLQHNDLASLDRHLFDGLTELIALNIFENKLMSLDKELFNGLTNLEQLAFSFNNLSSLPKDLFDGLTSLDWLDMGNNKLINLHKDQFDGLTSLRHLDMGDNKLINLHKDIFDGLSRLEWLNLDHNSLTSLDKDIFDGLSRLKSLHIGRNSLAGLHEDLFDELTSLESLYLLINLLTGLPDNLFDDKIAPPILSVNLLENDIKCFPASIINNGYTELIHPNKDKSCILTPTVRLVLSEATISEDGGQTELTATLDIPSGEVTRVSLTVDPPPSADYEVDTVPLVLTIAAGETVSDAITIMSVDNVIDEFAKTFTITGISTENVIGPEAIMFTIEDDEGMPTVTLVLSETTISEAGGQTELRARLDRPSGVATTVTITVDPPPPADYEVDTTPLVLTIGAGETVSGTITVTAVDNAMDEPDKTFTITGTSANSLGVIDPSAIRLTITDDDGRSSGLRLILEPGRISEARGVSWMTGLLDAPAATTLIVEISVASSSGITYNKHLRFAAGALRSSRSMIRAVDNAVDEPDREVGILGSSSELGSALALLTIVDDDDPPTVTLHLSHNPILEGGGVTTVTAMLTHPSIAETILVVSAASADSDLFSLSPNKTLIIAARQKESTGEVRITSRDNAQHGENGIVTVMGDAANSQGVIDPSAIRLTITDDDTRLPRLGLIVEPASISEGGEFSRVTAVLDEPFLTPLTVEITVGESVLLSPNRMLQIAAGEIESSGEVTVRAVDNEIDEPDREVGILGSSSELGSASVLLTIEDDDEVPRATLHLSPNPIREGGGMSRVTATLTHPSSAGTTIVVSAASDDSDLFSLSSNKTLTIAAGQRESSGLVTIISGDNAQHGLNAMVTVMGEAANERGIQGPAALTLQITDDERPTVSLHLSDTFISENGGTTTVTARLDSPVSLDLSILLSGDPVSDYVFLMDGVITTSPMLTIVGGERISRAHVTIRAMDNAVYGPATKVITLSGTSSGDVNRIGGVRFTITDDEEAPTVAFVLTPSRISEDGGITVLRSRLSHRSSTDVQVMVSATPSSGYEWRGASMFTIPAGHTESRREVRVTALDNDVHDRDQTITIQGTVVNLDVPHPFPAVLTIEDDEGVPTATLHVSRNPIREAGGSTTVTATLDHPSSEHTTVTVTARPHDPALFTLSGLPTLTIAANETRSTGRLTLRAVDNEEYGLDQVVTISGIARNSLGITGPAPVLLTILDDELAPLVLSIYDTRIREDESVARLSVELNRPTDQVVTVQYQTFDQSAEASTDYTASGGMVVFAPQATRGVIQIGILSDGIPEEAETFGVKLFHPRHAGIRRGVGTVTIEEAETIPSLRIHGMTTVDRVQFQVSLSHASSELITVRYRTEDGTAKAGRDYIASSGVLTFMPGQIKAMVGVVLLGSDGNRETFSMHLMDSEHAEIAKSVAVATVREAEAGQVMASYRPRFVRSSSVQIVEAVVERFRSGADGSVCGAGGRLWRWRPSLGELISGCRVSKSSGALGVWGRGAFRRFHGQGEVSLRASVSTAMVGADYRWNARWTVGLALAHSRGDGSYDRHPHSGAIASGLTGMYPYVGYWGRGMEVWMTGGYGWGTVRVPDLETDLAAGFGAMGVRGRVRRGLSYQGDVLYAEATGGGGDVYRIRLGMEGMFHLHEGIHPYIEAHMRQDGGSAETGIGLEVGSGVRVSVPSWQFKGELRSQGVLVHSATGFREWGISGSLQYGGGSRGILVRVRPSWGPGLGMTTYHSQTILDAVPHGRALDQTEVEIGYGVAFRSGEARSIMGITRRSEGAMLRLGGELRPWERFRVSVFGLANAEKTTLQPLGLHVQGTLHY